MNQSVGLCNPKNKAALLFLVHPNTGNGYGNLRTFIYNLFTTLSDTTQISSYQHNAVGGL